MAEYIERTEELKPCPFCGSAHIRRKCHSSYKFNEVWWSVKCLCCGAKIENRLFDTESDAVFAWNRRESAELPHADVTPVRHGQWLGVFERFPERKTSRAAWLGVFCSRCCNHADNMSDYCPNCGAKMDGGNDNDRHLHGERSDGETVLGV